MAPQRSRTLSITLVVALLALAILVFMTRTAPLAPASPDHGDSLFVHQETGTIGSSTYYQNTATTTFTDPTFGMTSTGSTSYPTTNYGDNTIETANNPAIVADVIRVANKITLTSPITIQSFVLYCVATYGHNIKFAVYPDSGGTPVGQTLVKQTDGYSVSGTGWVTVTLSSADYIYLPAGTYWLCYMGDTTAGRVRRKGTTTDYWVNGSYSSGYPTTFPSANSESKGPYSFYAISVQIEGYAKAMKATLSDYASVLSMSFYSHATGNFRLAIYADSSGSPSSKQWESSSTAATASAWNTVNINSGSPSSLTLSAGTYWLAWQWDNTNSGPSYTAGSSGNGNYIAQAYGSFPASWSGGTSSSENWSIYVTYTIPPNKPTSLQPTTRQTSTSVTISCVDTDNNGDMINVFFYDNSTKNLIDNVWISSGGTATRTWSGLSRGTTYSFFARGTDDPENEDAWGENSDVQSFLINSPPTPPTGWTDLGMNLTDHTPS